MKIDWIILVLVLFLVVVVARVALFAHWHDDRMNDELGLRIMLVYCTSHNDKTIIFIR